ncbi:hypothetical protein ASNO1_59040 [Corallococcus caeni]|uniref:Restriction endonuclease type IV Mrr domain-containing protein n=2 Tax=Corallococcus caeni TaxID=3082388 RepID=A0ABQ6R012_9BACT|nr:hypothetical protein ASNO1_59040 [Corallococcus sp. NO1]
MALLESEKGSDMLTVVPNAHLVGAITGIKRQVDVLIDARVAEDVSRRVIVDAKFRRRKIDVTDVEAFEGMMKDCRAQRGLLICSNGFTEAALRRAQEAITIRLLPAESVEHLDLSSWEPCLGTCAVKARGKSGGWVLYDQPLGFFTRDSPLSIQVVGKCDGCSDFHVWCWDCGTHLALCGEEAKAQCSCARFWLTSRESEGRDERGNQLESIALTRVNVGPPGIGYNTVDRRPLN